MVCFCVIAISNFQRIFTVTANKHISMGQMFLWVLVLDSKAHNSNPKINTQPKTLIILFFKDKFHEFHSPWDMKTQTHGLCFPHWIVLVDSNTYTNTTSTGQGHLENTGDRISPLFTEAYLELIFDYMLLQTSENISLWSHEVPQAKGDHTFFVNRCLEWCEGHHFWFLRNVKIFPVEFMEENFFRMEINELQEYWSDFWPGWWCY